MRSGSKIALLFALLVVVAVPMTAGGATAQEDLDTEGVVLEFSLQGNGDARVTVSTSFVIETESDRTAFNDLAEEFESGEGNVGFSYSTFEQASAAASEATGREMNLTGVQRTHSVENGTGTLRLSFTWTDFARVQGDRMYVGDAFNTTSGTWLPDLAADQTLIIRAKGYGVTTAPVGVSNGVLRWDGPRSFEPGYFDITYQRGLQSRTGSSSTQSPVDPPPGPSGTSLLVGLFVLGIGAVAVALYLRERDEDDGSVSAPPAGTDDPPSDDAEVIPPPDAADDDGIDLDLLSDEERIEHLLERNGGRMKQANIVRETGWSNAKVSQLLSAMDEDGQINKLRIGRENLISLPDEDVTEFEE